MLWQTGIAAFRAQDAPISRDPHLLHRDFHPLNVLWGAADVSGVVDWVNACVGHAHAEATRIGYPVMIKSTAGGGGIGMRLCWSADELGEAYQSVDRLARANF